MRCARAAGFVVASAFSLGLIAACGDKVGDPTGEDLALPDRIAPAGDGGVNDEEGGAADDDAADTSVPRPAMCNEPGLVLCFAFENDLANSAPGGGGPSNVQDVTFTEGVVGQAILLGSTSFIRSPTVAGFNPPVSTVEAWVRPMELVDDSVVFDADERFSMTIRKDGHLRCTPSTIANTVAISVGAWTHIACVFDGTKVHAYVNGVSQGIGDGKNGTHPTAGVAIGGNSPSGQPFVGAIDSLRLFTSARTAPQIAAAAIR